MLMISHTVAKTRIHGTPDKTQSEKGTLLCPAKGIQNAVLAAMIPMHHWDASIIKPLQFSTGLSCHSSSLTAPKPLMRDELWDTAAATKIQIDAIPLVNALFCEVNPIPVKKAMKLMGHEVGPLRMPLTELTEGNTEKLAKAMKEFGII